jgi:transcriptional regulator of heat shock response
MENKSEKILLDLVIEYFIKHWAPIWSKFLFNMEDVNMAPSTIRKHLNNLEKKGLIYQPYNSAWRIPTTDGVKLYVANVLNTKSDSSKNLIKINQWHNLRWFMDILWNVVDGIAFGYYKDESEISYLWIAKLLKKVNNNIEKIISLMEFVENKEIIWYLNKIEIKEKEINYNFLQYQWVNIALMYIKTDFEWREAIIWIIGSLRVDYKANIDILKQIINKN